MAQLGPLIADAVRHMEAADDLEGLVNRHELPDAGITVLEHLGEARGLIDSTIRSMAVYLSTHHGLSRRDVSRALGVSAATVQRWIQQDRNPD